MAGVLFDRLAQPELVLVLPLQAALDEWRARPPLDSMEKQDTEHPRRLLVQAHYDYAAAVCTMQLMVGV